MMLDAIAIVVPAIFTMVCLMVVLLINRSVRMNVKAMENFEGSLRKSDAIVNMEVRAGVKMERMINCLRDHLINQELATADLEICHKDFTHVMNEDFTIHDAKSVEKTGLDGHVVITSDHKLIYSTNIIAYLKKKDPF